MGNSQNLGDFSKRSGRRGRRRSYSETPSSSPSPPPKKSKKRRKTESEVEKYESTAGPDTFERTPPPPSEVTWQRRDHGRLPPGAVYAGRDSDDGPLFVGRFLHEGHLLPAKISPTHECAYSGLDGSEISSSHYEAMVCDPFLYAWRAASSGKRPPGAIPVGKMADGETLYAARSHYRGTVTPGKLHPSHGKLYIAYGGHEHGIKKYEVVVIREPNK